MQTWTIGDCTVTIEPATHEGRDGFDWSIRARDGDYSAGGWSPSQAGALGACLDKLQTLVAPPGTIPF